MWQLHRVELVHCSLSLAQHLLVAVLAVFFWAGRVDEDNGVNFAWDVVQYVARHHPSHWFE